MSDTVFALAYQAPAAPRRRPCYLLPLLGLTVMVGAPLLPVPDCLMRLIFRLLPFLTVDNVQLPVIAIPLVLSLLNGAVLAQVLITRRRGLVLACTALSLSLLGLALAVFFWIPAFRS